MKGASWVTILIGGGLVVAAVILLTGQKVVNGSVGFDPGGITVTPSGTGNTNDSGQGTP